MDEEQEVQEQEAPPVEEAPPEAEGEQKHPEHVEMPPEIQERFNKVYRKLKDYERGMHDLRELNTALYSKFEEQDTARVSETRDRTISDLQGQIAKAQQRGDYNRASELIGQLTDLKAEAKVRSLQPKPEPKKAPPPPDDDVETLRSWADEINEDQSFKRPWARPGHPLQRKAAALGQAYMDDPSFGGDINRVLAQVDKDMGLNGTQRTASAVLPANKGSGKKPDTKLSSEELAIANRMGITPERYAKQKALIGR